MPISLHTLTVNQFGDGRAVYIAGLPYSSENARLLCRAVFWSAAREELFPQWQSDNYYTECNTYPEAGYFCVVNNTPEHQTTQVHLPDGQVKQFELAPMEARWEVIS